MSDVICAGCAHTVGVHYPDTDIRGCSFKDAIGRTCLCPGFVKKPTGRHPNLDPPPTEDGTVSLDEVGVGSEVRYRGPLCDTVMSGEAVTIIVGIPAVLAGVVLSLRLMVWLFTKKL